MRIDVGGLDFDVAVGGPDGGPAVLLLHGFPENATVWEGVTPALQAAGLRTIAPDQRGYSPGARPDGAEAYRAADLVGDALGLLDALGVDAAHVLGHDWGAAVAWQLAARHPHRVRTLTALSVPHPIGYGHAVRHDAEQQRLSAYMLAFKVPVVAEKTLLALDARALRRIFGSGVPAEQVERYVRPLQEPGALTGALNWYRAMSGRDLEGLGPVTVPTTYVWGTEDVGVGRTAAESCAQHVTGDYQFVELPGLSHWLPEEHPDTVARLALARITGQPAGSDGAAPVAGGAQRARPEAMS